MSDSSDPKPRTRPGRTGSSRSSSKLDHARREAADCRACPLWKRATQTVFGEGSAGARIMFVGEQPGDKEDLAGRPFVGPAGNLLDRALDDAGIPRANTYVTNAVKHFKWEPRGKRRLHKTPAQAEVDACHRWLERELALVAPRVIVALGATAARALLRRAVTIGSNRGRLMEFSDQTQVLVTVHPSFLLRIPDESRAEAYRQFVADLKVAASAARKPPGRA